MPRVNSSARQKNKPFKSKKGKASKSGSKASKVAKTKPISKSLRKRAKLNKNQFVHNIKNKRVSEVDKLTNQNEYLDASTKEFVNMKLKEENEMKVIVLVGGNDDAEPAKVLEKLYQVVGEKEGFLSQVNLPSIPYPSLQIFPTPKSYIQSKMLIIAAKRQEQQLLGLYDLIKCADIICPVLSCKSTNTQAMNLDPYEQGKAFDEAGYVILNMIRSMGSPTTIGIVQDLELHEPRHHDKIQRLFKRFIVSELGQNSKVNYLKEKQQDTQKLLRQMDSTRSNRQNWKTQRGYMLVQNVSRDQETGNVTFTGFLKGNCVNANQLVHVTGFDDYAIQKIEIKDDMGKRSKRKQIDEEVNLVQHAVSSESLFPFSKAEQHGDDLLSAIEGLKLQNAEKKEEEMQEEDSGYEDQSDSQQDCDIDQYFGNKEEEKAKRVEMQMRKEDELEFEDEVEYAAEELLREKYREYQGLKNFKTSEWNRLENLPDVYDRIYTFKHYQQTANVIMQENIARAFAYPGFYISITLQGFPFEKLSENNGPILLSFLLKHERKMTQLHAKVRRNPYYPSNETIIKSNQEYLISMGFRRFITRPIFSRVISGTTKTKYTSNIKQDYESYFYCSFYYYNTLPPTPVQVFHINKFNKSQHEASAVMYGELLKCDPLHIILERIILTGYPFKINKRRSTVRFMFFNPKDVKYFKPIEVRTKSNKKGRIEQSIGTHGYMKVLFNDKVHQSDTVCMSLYRRVYPEPYF